MSRTQQQRKTVQQAADEFLKDYSTKQPSMHWGT
jgi:hypothetical protein